MQWTRKHLSFANVVSMVALFAALGGVSYAAIALPKNSVGAKQIKKNAVRSSEVKSNAIGAAEIKSDAVRAAEIQGNAVGASEIGPNAVAGDDIADGSVGAPDIGDNAVGAGEVTDGSIGTAEVANGSLTGDDVAANSLDGKVGPDAFARVQANGTLLATLPVDPPLPATSKNIDPEDVTNPAAGVYCFDNLPFAPASAMVASDNAGASAATQNNWIVSVAVERGNNLAGCPAGADARVVTTHVGDAIATANANHGFIIWFES